MRQAIIWTNADTIHWRNMLPCLNPISIILCQGCLWICIYEMNRYIYYFQFLLLYTHFPSVYILHLFLYSSLLASDVCLNTILCCADNQMKHVFSTISYIFFYLKTYKDYSFYFNFSETADEVMAWVGHYIMQKIHQYYAVVIHGIKSSYNHVITYPCHSLNITLLKAELNLGE